MPRGASAALAALRFSPESEFALNALAPEDWSQLLSFCDRNQLTLLLNTRAGHLFPEVIAEQVERRLESQHERTRRLKQSFLEIDSLMRREGIEFVVLKGFSHCPDFVQDLHTRVQYDVDLYCRPEQARRAYGALTQLGYEPVRGFERFPLDHLPTLIRKTGWEWRGDFFDPDIPYSVEVHFRLWDLETERLNPTGLEEFWSRRIVRQVHGLEFTSFDPVDAVGYACLHLFRHILRGDLRPLHLYEIASFLNTHSAAHDFWQRLQASHEPSLRRIEAVCFRLASHAFDCALPAELHADIASLPAGVHRWFEESGDAPLASLFHPNKEELWLHLSLLDSPSDRLAVFARRLIPQRLPGPVDAVHLPAEQITWRIRLRSSRRYLLFVSARFARHGRLLIPTLWKGARWWSYNQGLSQQFWRFLAAAAVFEVGLFIFYLLYNLFLLDRGFHEDFLGATAGAMQIGGIVGTIPGGMAARRYGTRNVLRAAFALTAIILTLRVAVLDPAVLLTLAFVSGALSACWAVCIPPVIAELASEETRPLAFSLFFSAGIGLGVLGGLLGGYLPRIAMQAGIPGAWSKSSSLFVGCALVLCASLLISRLRLSSAELQETTLNPRNPLLFRFLLVTASFSLGTGAFNPLYSAYLTTHANLGVERIGTVFAASQLAQFFAILLAPLVVKRLGSEAAITYMFAATGAALLCLASGPVGILAALAYILYMSFQYMSEPVMFNLLISVASPGERKGASMLNFFIVNGAQAIAAALAGWGVSRLGYGPVFEAAAGFVLLAALLFRVLLGRRAASAITSATSV